MPIVFAVLALSVFAIACSYVPEYPKKGVFSFWTNESVLEQAFLDAIKRLTDAGITAFAYVTINVDKSGVPVKYATPEQMKKLCNSKPEKGSWIAGCTSYAASDGHVDGLYILPDAAYEYVVGVMQHELIHIVLNLRQHNPKEGNLFSAKLGSNDLTQSDLDWICKFTDCIDPHLPPPRVGKMKG